MLLLAKMYNLDFRDFRKNEGNGEDFGILWEGLTDNSLYDSAFLFSQDLTYLAFDIHGLMYSSVR